MNSVDGVDLEEFRVFVPESFTFYCSCEGHLCFEDQGDEVAATSARVGAGLLHLLWCLILLVLWPIRCGLCRQRHLVLRDYPFSKVLEGFYRVSIIFRLERERKGVSEFSASPHVSVVRQSGNRSQVSAAGLCCLL